MVKVRAFFRNEDASGLAHTDRVLARIPAVGEFLQLQPRGDWYVVQAVVVGAIPSANQAELYVALMDRDAFLAAFIAPPADN